jgi:hypothetical protein
MKTIIHINKHIIASNRIHGRREAPITVKTYKENRKCHEATVTGPCRIVHGDKPLSCGARVWTETESPVLIL